MKLFNFDPRTMDRHGRTRTHGIYGTGLGEAYFRDPDSVVSAVQEHATRTMGGNWANLPLSECTPRNILFLEYY